jgi:hypothetical protein
VINPLVAKFTAEQAEKLNDLVRDGEFHLGTVAAGADPLPRDLKDFVPKCEVCTQPIPKRRLCSRDANRTKHSCSAACEAVLRKAQVARTVARMCINCKHPSTPEERADFIAWRKACGKVRLQRGNPERHPQTRMVRLELLAALKRALGRLRGEVATESLADFLEEMQNLVDGNMVKKRTLRTGGETAATDQANKGDDDGSTC